MTSFGTIAALTLIAIAILLLKDRVSNNFPKLFPKPKPRARGNLIVLVVSRSVEFCAIGAMIYLAITESETLTHSFDRSLRWVFTITLTISVMVSYYRKTSLEPTATAKP
jgi:hypothetical protein